MTDNIRPKIWKHIGLYGHAVGTFALTPDGVTWKSAVLGTNGQHDDADIETRKSLPKSSIAGALWTVFGKSGHLRILTKNNDTNGSNNNNDGSSKKDSSNKLPSAMRFDGFPPSDYESLCETLSALYGVSCKRHTMSTAGNSWGNTDITNKHLVFRQCRLEKGGNYDTTSNGREGLEEGEEFEPRDGEEMLSLDLGEVSQCVLPGNNRNEIEMQFLESDTVGADQLVAIRFYVPPDADADPTDKDAPTSAEVLQSHIMNAASVKKTSGAIIAEFEEVKGTFLTPRGRYAIELYDAFLRMRGAKYDFKIRYDDISRLFLLPRQDDMHMAFVIALDKPIRQGQQRYNMLVMQCTKEHSELEINLDDAILEKEYGGDIQSRMEGSFSNIVAKTFKVITRKKVFIPGKFANANQQAWVKCALRANEGHLYPLEKQFIFIHKPAVLIRFDEVESVEFQRYAGGQGSTRNFDLNVTLHATPGDGPATREYTFSGIDKTNYAALYSFLSGKKIRILNLEGSGGPSAMDEETSPSGGDRVRPAAGAMDEADDDDDEESEDEDYDQAKGSGEESGDGGGSDDDDDDEDDDDMGSVDSDDSDLKEYKKKASAKKKDVVSKSKKPAGDDDGKKRKASSSPIKKAAAKKKKKDPNAPKGAMSAFMYFSTAKRSEIKEANPDASFGDIGKLVGAAWKELSDDKKVKWEEKAKEDKARYAKEMSNYSAPEDSDDDDSDDSDGGKGKKKPAVKKAKKDPNAPKGAKSAFMYFSNAKRSEIKEANPDASFGDIGKLIGAAWKELNDSQKVKWEEMAKEDKTRYTKEMSNYKPAETKNKPAETKKKAAAVTKKPVESKKKPAAPASDESSEAGSSSFESDSDSDDDSDSD